MFRRLEKVPAFELLSVGLGAVTEGEEKEKGGLKMSTSTSMSTSISMSSLNGNPPANLANQLWRKYTLTIPNFECEILEVFPDRNMFLGGEKWLTGENNEEKQAVSELLSSMKTGDVASTVNRGLQATAVVGFLLMLAFELAMYTGGRWNAC
ncbi:hypothetical protein NLJ89_g9807 [Agrocybe chaxingu]|uniref:Uncharacterized protein n=1 Tax=Agrocybe chaxingu TaxID=84603 RepID=A0A9W8JSV8_9AGAR|nr:hypothetical protein NLJ89_g9807 [Agrocybe chaxingu]